MHTTDHLGNEFSSIKSMCDHWNITIPVYKYRLKTGKTLKETLTGNYDKTWTPRDCGKPAYIFSKNEETFIFENLRKYSKREDFLKDAQKIYPNLTAYRVKCFVSDHPELKRRKYDNLKLTKAQIKFIHSNIRKHTYSEIIQMVNEKWNINIPKHTLYCAIKELENKGTIDKHKRCHFHEMYEIFKNWDSEHQIYRLYQKTPDDPRKPYEEVIWEEYHGPKPKGHSIIFLDGNYMNCSIENLACVSKSVLNSMTNTHGTIDYIVPQCTKIAIMTAELSCKKNQMMKERTKHVKETRLRQKEERLNMSAVMKNGHIATIVEYNAADDITIRFEDGKINKTKWCLFEKGLAPYPTKKLDTKWFKEYVKEKTGDEYSILGEYVSQNTRIKMRHNKCGREYFVRPGSFIHRNSRCCACSYIGRRHSYKK